MTSKVIKVTKTTFLFKKKISSIYFVFYEPILFKISVNANIVKTQVFYKMKYDLKGHSRSQRRPFYLKIHFFFNIFSFVHVIDSFYKIIFYEQQKTKAIKISKYPVNAPNRLTMFIDYTSPLYCTSFVLEVNYTLCKGICGAYLWLRHSPV